MTAAVDVCLLSGNDKNLVTSNLSRMREFEGAGPKFSSLGLASYLYGVDK